MTHQYPHILSNLSSRTHPHPRERHRWRMDRWRRCLIFFFRHHPRGRRVAIFCRANYATSSPPTHRHTKQKRTHSTRCSYCGDMCVPPMLTPNCVSSDERSESMREWCLEQIADGPVVFSSDEDSGWTEEDTAAVYKRFRKVPTIALARYTMDSVTRYQEMCPNSMVRAIICRLIWQNSVFRHFLSIHVVVTSLFYAGCALPSLAALFLSFPCARKHRTTIFFYCLERIFTLKLCSRASVRQRGKRA